MNLHMAGQVFGCSTLTWGDTVVRQHLDQLSFCTQGQHSQLQYDKGVRKGAQNYSSQTTMTSLSQLEGVSSHS